jgi:hypothetical protein
LIAVSSVSMAMFTPAQKPRGLASRMCMGDPNGGGHAAEADGTLS